MFLERLPSYSICNYPFAKVSDPIAFWSLPITELSSPFKIPVSSPYIPSAQVGPVGPLGEEGVVYVFMLSNLLLILTAGSWGLRGWHRADGPNGS